MLLKTPPSLRNLARVCTHVTCDGRFDKRLCFVDVEGSRQYAQALAQSGILTSGEANQICDGLDKVIYTARLSQPSSQ